jgi:tRNA (guanosine-2'-O-)-methyltransferase
VTIAALWLAACGPSMPAKAPGTSVQATNLTPPPGTTLVQACTPTGPELCFNAIDDTCTGVIDEGCGVQTGTLQFAIAWSAATADVNITLVTPAHERVPNERTRSTASGFHLDRDCPADEGCNGQNVENIFFDGIQPPPGHYMVEITLVDPHGADAPVKVRFGARLGARTVGFDVDVAPGDDAKKTFAFDVP